MVIIETEDQNFPKEKRTLAGREAFPVAFEPSKPTCIFWPDPQRIKGAGRLRVTAAVDERVRHQVAVLNAVSGEHYGVIDILFACPGQVYGLDLSASQTTAALRDGLELRLTKNTTPLWLIAPGPHAPAAVLPHISPLGGEPHLDQFLDVFCSDASLQPCDWMGICVLDGLADWADLGREDAKLALERQLDVAFDPVTGTRENFRSQPCDAASGGPETTGPFARLALARPQDPALALAEKGFIDCYMPELNVVGHNLVSESAYNIAYPMMALAVASGKSEYFEKSIHQLEVLRTYLPIDDQLWLRYFPKSGQRTFPGWSRGVAWYYLGMVRTLALLPATDRPASLIDEISRLATWVEDHQLENGLWSCFMKEPTVSPDTSGCAGVAAAIAIAIKQDMLPSDHLPVAVQAYQRLCADYLDSDGWLRGASQSNKPEAEAYDVQRHDFRVIAPWGMGLFAQLAAAVSSSIDK